jgi:hypothetical protein
LPQEFTSCALPISAGNSHYIGGDRAIEGSGEEGGEAAWIGVLQIDLVWTVVIKGGAMDNNFSPPFNCLLDKGVAIMVEPLEGHKD